MKRLTQSFVVLFYLDALLATLSGISVTASLFIAERGPSSMEFLGVSVVVSLAFFLIAVLLGATAIQVAGIARIAASEQKGSGELGRRVVRLLVILSCAGFFLFVVLAAMAYGILSRIDQGFAVFG